jgi:hypothetical protein
MLKWVRSVHFPFILKLYCWLIRREGWGTSAVKRLRLQSRYKSGLEPFLQ